MRRTWRKQYQSQSAPHIPRIQVPASAVDNSLLKDLNQGQRCYFYSIMKIYDSRPQWKALQTRYIHSLGYQQQLGYITRQEALSCAAVLRHSTTKASGLAAPGRTVPPKSSAKQRKSQPARPGFSVGPKVPSISRRTSRPKTVRSL
ncbi:protein FAM216B [Acomys russatus]|uniref:protein FAM216B n=1 Tax=Acomys russatus TaxID=60746 RepID=UPI0021E24DE8|nr:protein FAM216B [Acomys russatus]